MTYDDLYWKLSELITKCYEKHCKVTVLFSVQTTAKSCLIHFFGLFVSYLFINTLSWSKCWRYVETDLFPIEFDGDSQKERSWLSFKHDINTSEIPKIVSTYTFCIIIYRWHCGTVYWPSDLVPITTSLIQNVQN